MLASCANCTHSASASENGASRCALGVALSGGALLCDRYTITPAFRDEIVRKAYADIRAEINLAIVKSKARKGAMYAG